jgi:uncharacterized membrane protein
MIVAILRPEHSSGKKKAIICWENIYVILSYPLKTFCFMYTLYMTIKSNNIESTSGGNNTIASAKCLLTIIFLFNNTFYKKSFKLQIENTLQKNSLCT